MPAQTIYTKNLRWIDITDPKPEDVEWLRANFKFHNLHLSAVTEYQQRPHIDEGDCYDFMVLLFPVYDRQTQEIVNGEVDFFVSKNLIITVHYGQIFTLKNLFNETRNSTDIRNAFMQKGAGYLLYKVLESLFKRSYPILDHMSEDIGVIEKGVFHHRGENVLSQITLMKKNIIEFRKMMKTHRYVLEKLPKRTTIYLNFPQSKLYYRDLLEYYENIWDILEAQKETADALAETYQSLVSHRLNEITKTISIFSAIAIPATLVAFIFAVDMRGMPFSDHPQGFWIVALFMAAASLGMLWIFKSKKWF